MRVRYWGSVVGMVRLMGNMLGSQIWMPKGTLLMLANLVGLRNRVVLMNGG